jgi:putative transposase
VGIFRLEKNAIVIIERAHWRLRKKRGTHWQLEEVNTGTIIEKKESDLLVMHFHGELSGTLGGRSPKASITTRELSPSEKDEIRWRLSFVKAAYDLPVTEAIYNVAVTEGLRNYEKELKRHLASYGVEVDTILAHQHKEPPYWTTVYRWVMLYKQAGDDAYALLTKAREQEHILDSDLLQIIDDTIEDDYLTREREPLQAAIDTAKQKTKNENEKREKLGKPLLDIPSRRDVQRRLALLPAFDVCAARYGRQFALVKFRSVKGHRTTTYILERVEIDHTPLDLFVVDDEKGVPLGRPYITMCIDDFSRCILGIYIGFIPPSYLSVSLCLIHAFFPKVTLNSDHPEVEHPWVGFGIMRDLVVDQATEFHSEALEDACGRLGINIEYAPRKQGWYKAKIERVLGELNRKVAHGTRGTTFSNIFERGDYNPEKYATIRLSTLKLGIHMWVCDVYHEKPHRSLDMPPSMMWRLNAQIQDIPLPHDRHVLDVVMGRPHSRVLTHSGIQYEGLFYGGSAVHDLRLLYGADLDVQIRVNESDLGTIHVVYANEIVVAEALRFDYANGLSLWLHKQIQANTTKYDCDSWMEAMLRLKTLFRGEKQALKDMSRRGKGRAGESLKSPKLPEAKAPLQLPASTGAQDAKNACNVLSIEEPLVIPQYSAVAVKKDQ